jgi:hypothetical protein
MMRHHLNKGRVDSTKAGFPECDPLLSELLIWASPLRFGAQMGVQWGRSTGCFVYS